MIFQANGIKWKHGAESLSFTDSNRKGSVAGQLRTLSGKDDSKTCIENKCAFVAILATRNQGNYSLLVKNQRNALILLKLNDLLIFCWQNGLEDSTRTREPNYMISKWAIVKYFFFKKEMILRAWERETMAPFELIGFWFSKWGQFQLDDIGPYVKNVDTSSGRDVMTGHCFHPMIAWRCPGKVSSSYWKRTETDIVACEAISAGTCIIWTMNLTESLCVWAN